MTQAKILLLAALSLLASTAQAAAAMPQPVLRVVSATETAIWIRYELSVDNRNDFDRALFRPTPDLASCYASANTAMVHVHEIGIPGAVHVFCPANRRSLGSIRYAVKKNALQTGHVRIRIFDQLNNQSIWSNIAIANLPRPVTGVDHTPPPPVSTPTPTPRAQIRTGAGLCLDVREAEMTTNGGRVEAWACNGRPHQSWGYDRTSRAVRVAGGHCLDVRAGINQNGNHVQVWSCNGQWQQQWMPLENGALQNAGGFCLDVHAPDQTRNGARVQIWQCNGSQQQRFTSSVF